MITYLIYITSAFKNLEEVDNFCSNYLVTNEHLKIFRYVVQNLNTLVIAFKSDYEPEILSVDIGETLINDKRVLFYYMIKKDDIITYFMPRNISETLFFEEDNNEQTPLTGKKNKEIINVNEKENVLNKILDKIEEYGIGSLTEKEKNFLDHFYM